MTIFLRDDGKQLILKADTLDDAIELVGASQFSESLKAGIWLESRRSNYLQLIVPIGVHQAKNG